MRDLRVAAQQQVEIAKALTLNARLLIFDEPTAALGGEETERLFEQIGQLKPEGVSSSISAIGSTRSPASPTASPCCATGSLCATHETSTGADQDAGRGDGRPAARPHVPADPVRAAPKAETLIEVEGLTSAEGAFSDVTSRSRPAKCSASPGIVGAGRTELVRAIAGADPGLGRLGQGRRRSRSASMGPRDALGQGDRAGSRGPQGAGPRSDADDRRESRARQLSDAVAPNGWIIPRAAQAFRPGRHRRALASRARPNNWSASFPAATSRRWSSPRASRASPRSSSSTSRRAASTSARARQSTR